MPCSPIALSQGRFLIIHGVRRNRIVDAVIRREPCDGAKFCVARFVRLGEGAELVITSCPSQSRPGQCCCMPSESRLLPSSSSFFVQYGRERLAEFGGFAPQIRVRHPRNLLQSPVSCA